VVTNFHVIDRADGARVTLSDHSVWNAKLVGISPRNDIAVLRIEKTGSPLSHVVLGSSHDLAVGQQVFAIGSPFGLVEVQREESRRICSLERARLLGGDRQLRADPPRSLHERRGAVRRGGQQQQETRCYFFEAWK